MFTRGREIIRRLLEPRSWLAASSLAASSLAASSLAALAASAPAQRLFVTNYDESDGMPNSCIRDLAQDPEGRLWCLADDGILRFDGTEWERIPTELDTYSSTRLRLDTRGRPWMIHSTGVIIESSSSGWITHPGGQIVRRDTNFESDFDVGFSDGQDGPTIVLVSPANGVQVWSRDKWREITPDGDRRRLQARAVCVDQSRSLVATEHGVAIVRDATMDFETPLALGIPNSSILGIGFDPERGPAQLDGLWVVGAGWIGIVRDGAFHKVVSEWTCNEFGAHGFVHVAADGMGSLFIADATTTWLASARRGTVHLLDSARGLRESGANALMLDREYVVWIGNHSGLSKIPSLRFANYDIEHGLRDDVVASTLELDSGRMLFGHASCVSIEESGSFVRSEVLAPKDSLFEHGRMLAACSDGTGGAFLAAWSLGLLHCSPSGTLTPITARCDPVEKPSGVARDPSGGVWVGGSKGAAKLDPNLGDWVEDSKETADLVRSVNIDRKGRVYAAARDGLHLYDGAGWTTITNDRGPVWNDLWCAVETHDGRIWVGSRAGLEFLTNGTLVAPTEPELCISRPVFAVLEARDNSVWMATDDGVRVWNGSRIETFSVEHGLCGHDLNRGALTLDRSGRVWIGSDRGVSLYDQALDRRNRPPPILSIQSIEVDSVPHAPTDVVEIPDGAHSLVVHASAISFVDEHRIRYHFQLANFDPRELSQVGNTRFETRYTNLAPGEYRFEIRAETIEGVSTEIQRSLPIVVQRPVWQQRWFLGIAAAVLAALGIGLHFELAYRRYVRVLAEQVSERTRELSNSRAEIRGEKERLAAALANIADGVVTIDASGLITLINRGALELFACSEPDAIGRAVLDLVRLDRADGLPFDSSILRTPNVDAGGSDALAGVELSLTRKTGEPRMVEIAVAPLVDGDGRASGAVLAFHDVTERRRLEGEIARTERLQSLGVLAGGIAHDFNNVLTAVGGHVGLLEVELPPDQRFDLRLRAIDKALTRARELSQQLVTFARGGDPVRSPAAIDSMVRDAAQLAFSGSRVRWETDLPAELWPVDVDQSQVQRVLENLLINARQAMQSGGRVKLAARNVHAGRRDHPALEPGRYVRVDVEDEGPGISPENIERVFDPFFTTKSGGTGLGLATAYSVVHRHGGAITVRSRVGAGTVFSVYLPVSERKPSPKDGESEAATHVCARVLVLDDQADVLEVLTAMLQRLGCIVVDAADEASAVEHCRRAVEEGRPFDAAFLDLTLPGGPGGVDVARRVAAIDPQVRLIAMSGYSDDPVLARPEQFGFCGMLRKPFRIADVARVLEAAVARAPRTG